MLKPATPTAQGRSVPERLCAELKNRVGEAHKCVANTEKDGK